MEINPEVGWLMPNVVFPDGSRQNLCKRLPTPWDLIVRRFLIRHGLALNSDRQTRFECGDLDLSVPRTIPYLSGCFAFIRAEILNMVGGFDERFFLYLEDTDLVRRIGEIALTVFYPYVTVCHRYARGSYYNRRLFLHHVVSAIRYFSKWGWFFDRRRALINESIAFDDRVHSTPQLAEALPSR
jgi:GT2 family glycosyltransferase